MGAGIPIGAISQAVNSAPQINQPLGGPIQMPGTGGKGGSYSASAGSPPTTPTIDTSQPLGGPIQTTGKGPTIGAINQGPPNTSSTFVNPSLINSTGGISGLLAGNTPAAPTAAPAYTPMPSTYDQYMAQSNGMMTMDLKPWSGTMGANGAWTPNTDIPAAYAAYAAQQNAQNSPQSNIALPAAPATGVNLSGAIGQYQNQTLPKNNISRAPISNLPTTPNTPATPITPPVNTQNIKKFVPPPKTFNQFGTPINQVRQAGLSTPQTQINPRNNLLQNTSRFKKR